MKKIVWLLLPAAMIFSACGPGSSDRETAAKNESVTDTLKGDIRIAAIPVMVPMAEVWAGEFMKAHPNVRINVRGVMPGQAMQKLTGGSADLALLPGPVSKEDADKGMWTAPVAIDAMLPVISFDNDFIQPIVMNGISREKLKGIFSGKIKTWGQVTGRKANDPVEVYLQADSSDASESWFAYLGMKPSEAKGRLVSGDVQMIKDLSEAGKGIGYTSMISLYDPGSGKRKDGIYVVPVDLNGNNVIEDNEQFYDDFKMLSAAVGSGKLPVPPAREIFIKSMERPKTTVIREFVKWVLTTGQNYMPQSGYVNISKARADAAVSGLN